MYQPSSFNQVMYSLISNCEAGHFESAIDCLYLLSDFFDLECFMCGSEDCIESRMYSLFYRMIPLGIYTDPSFHSEFERTLHQFMAYAVYGSPHFMIHSFPKLADDIKKPIVYKYITVYYAFLFSKLKYSQQVKRLKLLWNMMFACPPNCLNDIPDSVFELILEVKNEEEISSLLLILCNSNNINAIQILLRKNIDRLLPFVWLNAPLKIVYSLFKAFKNNGKEIINNNLDLVPLFARLADFIADETPDQMGYALSIAKMVLHMVNEQNIFGLYPIIKTIIKKLNTTNSLANKPLYLKFLINCLKMNSSKNDGCKLLINEQIDNMAQYFYDLDDHSSSQKYFLRFLLFNIKGKEQEFQNSNKLYDLMKNITSNRNNKALKELIISFISYENELKFLLKEPANPDNPISKSKFDFIYDRLFIPIPSESNTRLWIIRLISQYNDSIKMSKIIYDIVNCSEIKFYIDDLCFAINKLQIFVEASKLDWFSPKFSHFNLLLLQNNWSTDKSYFEFVNEFLKENIIGIHNLFPILDLFCKYPKESSHIVLMQLVTLLKMLLDNIGYESRWDLQEKGIIVNFETTPWTTKAQILDEYNSIHTLFQNTYYCHLIKKVATTLIKLIHFSHDLLNEHLILFFMILGRNLTKITPVEGAKLYFKMVKELASNSHKISESFQKKIKAQISSFVVNFYKQHLFFECSTLFVKIFLTSRANNYNDALKEIKDYVIDAVSKDADIASKFQSFIDQPLRPMKTFSVFTDEKHQNWVKDCKEQFSEDQWILPNSKNNIQNDDNRKTETTFKNISFDFNKDALKVFDGPIIREGGNKSRMNIISFLWYSKNAINESFYSEIERFVFNTPEDPRLALGFISYLISNGRKTDIAKLIFSVGNCINYYNSYSLYSAILLLEYIRKQYIHDMDETQKSILSNFINRLLDEIGVYDHDNDSILNIFTNLRSSNIYQWMILRGIIGLNIELFNEKNSFIITKEFNEDLQETISFALGILAGQGSMNYNTLNNVASVLSSVFVQKANYSKIKPFYNLPTRVTHHPLFYDIGDPNLIQLPLSINNISVSILKILSEKFDVQLLKDESARIAFPYSFCSILTNLAFTDLQSQDKIDVILEKAAYLYPDRIRSVLYHFQEFYDVREIIDKFIRCKPPSASRGFFRSLIRMGNSRPDLINSFKAKFKDIFQDVNETPGELAYDGMKVDGFPVNINNITIEKSLRLDKPLSHDRIINAKSSLSIPSFESISLYDSLFGLSENEVLQTKAWNSLQAMKSEITKQLLETATDKQCHTCLASDILTYLFQKCTFNQLAEIVFNEEFMKKAKLSNLLCIVCVLKKSLIFSNSSEELLKKLENLLKIENNTFGDDQLNNLFSKATQGDILSITKILESHEVI